MKELMNKFDECLNAWNDLPDYVYTKEYRKVFMEFAKSKDKIDPSLALMVLHHETGNRTSYFKFNRCVVKLDKKIRRYKLIDIHFNLVKEGKYIFARYLFKFILKKNITLGLSDVDNELEMILSSVGCKLVYGRNYSCRAYL